MSYGLSTAADIAYNTHIYSLVTPTQYTTLTAMSQAAVLIGQTLSAILAQLLVSVAKVRVCASQLSIVSLIIFIFIAHYRPRT